MASAVDREWLTAQANRVDHELGADGVVRALSRDFYGAIRLTERAVEPDFEIAQRLLADAYLARGLSAADWQLVRRLRFAGIEDDVRERVRRAAAGRRALQDVDLAGSVSWTVGQELGRLAPETIRLPSGRHARLEYNEDGSVAASARLQELFGLASTPRVGPRGEPVVLTLLAPNNRPVQITRDLRSFWERTYPEVRQELKGRYPRHPWPEDPWTAAPTAKTNRRGSN
jgi:ATP-dependent helicase HrpB